MPNRKKSTNKIDFQDFVSQLENMILTGGFKPRERLVEANISQIFNVSRYWVRDAFKILETKELIDITPFKGVVVRELSENEVKEIFVIRVALERLAVNQAMQNAGEKDYQALHKLVEDFEKAMEDRDLAAMIAADAAFHDYIFDLAQNQTLKKIINDLRKRCHIIRYSAWSSPEIRGKITEEHRLFIDCLQAKDPQKLNHVAEEHISHAKDFYLFQLRTEGLPGL